MGHFVAKSWPLVCSQATDRPAHMGWSGYLGEMMFDILSLAALLSAAEPAKAAADADPKILVHRVATEEEHWAVNAYWIEDRDQVVIVDSLLLSTDAERLAGVIQQTGKPVTALLVTHTHPDHVMGIDVLQDELGDFPVYGTQAMKDGIDQHVEQFMSGAFYETWKDHMRTDLSPQIDRVVEEGDRLTFGTMTFTVMDMGPGESEASAVYHLASEKALFTGDLVMSFHHYFVAEGRTNEVIAQLDRLIAERTGDTEWVYTGHGATVRPDYLHVQKDWVVALRDEFVRLSEDPANRDAETGTLTRDAALLLAQHMDRLYPGYGDYGIGAETITYWNAYGLAAQYPMPGAASTQD